MSLCFQPGHLQACFDGSPEGPQGPAQRRGAAPADSTGRVLGTARPPGSLRAHGAGCTRGDEEAPTRQDGVAGPATHSRNRIPGSASPPAVSGSIRETRAGEKFFQKVRLPLRAGSQLLPRAPSGQGAPSRHVTPQEGVGAGGSAELCGTQGGVPWWPPRGSLGPVALSLLKMPNQKKKKVFMRHFFSYPSISIGIAIA